jgi:hypothetical protein
VVRDFLHLAEIKYVRDSAAKSNRDLFGDEWDALLTIALRDSEEFSRNIVRLYSIDKEAMLLSLGKYPDLDKVSSVDLDNAVRAFLAPKAYDRYDDWPDHRRRVINVTILLFMRLACEDHREGKRRVIVDEFVRRIIGWAIQDAAQGTLSIPSEYAHEDWSQMAVIGPDILANAAGLYLRR